MKGKKLTTEQKLKDCMKRLDSLVKQWYRENNPSSHDKYWSAYGFDTGFGLTVQPYDGGYRNIM